jgi:hypothetical protein
MTGSSLAGIVGASAGVISAMALVIGALPALIKVLRQVREVHKIVNQQRTDMQNYQRALERALREHGIDVPVDQSVVPPPDYAV